MRKFQRFFNDLTEINYQLRQGRTPAKKLIGDSTKNHRTFTVNQVIRLLRKLGNKRAADKIQSVYTVLRPYIKSDRKRSTKRTDAYDIAEFVSTYRAIVMEDRKLRKTIGRRLG